MRYCLNKNGSFSLTWEETQKGATGYQIIYSSDIDFKTNVHSWTTTDLKHTSETFSKVPRPGQTWYIKIRAFVTKDGKASSTRYGDYYGPVVCKPRVTDKDGYFVRPFHFGNW